MASIRSQNIPPFLVMDVLEKAQELQRAGQEVIHLEIGEPDFDTPHKITAAAIAAIQKGETHYTHSLGILPLREAIVAHYHKRYGVSISPEQVIVTMGTSPGLLLILCALLDPGDEVILSNPAYACYPNFVSYIEGVPVAVPVHAEEGFTFQPKAIQQKMGSRTKGILINSPSNPTGTVLRADVLQEIGQLGPYVISDEIYHGLVYGEQEHSILEFTDRAFVLNGFSKLYAMTGWRLGWVIAPKEFVRPMQKTQQNLFICASSVSQWAGLAALTEDHPEIPRMVATYDERRKFMVKGLRELGLRIAVEPTGAFYVLADARSLRCASLDLAFDILAKAHVAVAPGIDFGSNAEGFLRFSYANSIENIGRGMEKLGEYLRACGGTWALSSSKASSV
jgi:aspartate/methionine/tyrosine aminotransferase